MRGQIPLLPARHGMSSRLKIGHLILIFALAALPFAATFATYYPDERHYTDGALMMLKHGDWLVPHTAAGSPRFEKPPLAYWTIAASYKFFGVNVIASRLPFLLTSCATLWLTFRLAQKLTGKNKTALLAALVLASHPQFFLCSIRTIPDALLVFFVTLSGYGFLRLIVFEEFAAGAFWAAYGGAAGAALSKGLLGAGIVVFAWAFVFSRERNFGAVKKLVHWPSVATATVFAASWFTYILATHGKAALGVLFGDQVTGNFHGHFWSPLLRAPVFALFLIFNFLPWSTTTIEFLARRKVLEAGDIPPVARQFIIAWAAALIIGFSLGANVSLRYLLPATPLVAILIADCLQKSENVRLIFSVRNVLKVVLIALALADMGGFFVVLQWPMPLVALILIFGVILIGIAVLGFSAFQKKSFSAAEGLALAILLGWVILFTTAMPVLLPDRSQQIAAVLLRTQKDSRRPVLLLGDMELASRVRVCLGQNWTVMQAGKLRQVTPADYACILVSEKNVGEFFGKGWNVQTVAESAGAPSRAELWAALKSGRLPEALARHGKKTYLVTRE
jgi:4-amino-4-deoxy-L-arabinose transferase-like glycosyltransferase